VCTGAVYPASDLEVVVQAPEGKATSLAIFPAVDEIREGGRTLDCRDIGIFREYTGFPTVESIPLQVHLNGRASANAGPATEESSWDEAAEYGVEFPGASDGLLRIHYFGDAARVYADGKLVLDNFWNGQPFELPLWRLPNSANTRLTIKILPWGSPTDRILDESVKQALLQGEAHSDMAPQVWVVGTGEINLTIVQVDPPL
jgi:hypothetical protein